MAEGRADGAPSVAETRTRRTALEVALGVRWGGDQAMEGRLGTEAGQRHHCAPWSQSLVFT